MAWEKNKDERLARQSVESTATAVVGLVKFARGESQIVRCRREGANTVEVLPKSKESLSEEQLEYAA